MEGSQALDKTIRSPNDDLGRQKVKQSKQVRKFRECA